MKDVDKVTSQIWSSGCYKQTVFLEMAVHEAIADPFTKSVEHRDLSCSYVEVRTHDFSLPAARGMQWMCSNQRLNSN